MFKFIFLAFLIPFVITTTPLQHSSDFTATTFSSPFGWSVAFGNVGYQTENSQTLFGGVNNFDVSTQIQKIFILPPHYLIRIMVTIWTFGQWNNGEIKMLCDDKQIMSKKLYTMQNIYHKSPTIVNVVNNHNANTAIISIRPQIQDKYTQSWGIRDFIIQYYPCPNGCQICLDTDKQSSDCNKWIVNYQQFTSNTISEMHNEGWFVNDDKIQYTFDQCNGLSLFGYYGQGITLKRTFYLEPHNKIRIQFLFVKLNDWGQQSFKIFIDDFLQLTIKATSNQMYHKNYCDSNVELDYIQRVDLQLSHSNEFSKFEIINTLKITDINIKFGIRDFLLFVSCDNCVKENIFQDTPFAYFTTNIPIQSHWLIKNQQIVESKFYNCSNTTSVSLPTNEYTILGRFTKNDFLQQTFKLFPHRQLILSITLYFLDTWLDEFFIIEMDGQVIYREEFDVIYDKDNFCGWENFGDKKVEFTKTFSDHQSSSITIKIYSTLDEEAWNESFGIKNFRIQLGDCPQDCQQCNNIVGDHCTFYVWDEYYQLKDKYFWKSEGWGSIIEVDPINQITSCETINIFGGQIQHQGYLQLTQNLILHTKLKIQFKLYILGDWINDTITVKADEYIIYSKAITATYSNLICSSNIKAFIIMIEEVIDHYRSFVVIKITNDMPIEPLDNKSFGIRDFYLYQNIV